MFTTIVLIILLIALALITIRFVYPELIYSIRQASVEVEIGRALMASDEDDRNASKWFNQAQIKDIRFEISSPDDEGIRSRIANIKKLYHLSNREQDLNTPKDCLVELANLLSSYGDHIVPDEDLNRPLCLAEEVLELIVNGIAAKGSRPRKVTAEELPTWLVEHPVSIEQVLEILSATLFALSYRHRAHENKK